jgi:deoxyribose-phosphate aldolase
LKSHELAKYIDHSILHTDLTSKELFDFCQSAIRMGVFSVAINSCWVEETLKYLKGSGIIVDSSIGFPLGQNNRKGKIEEARFAVSAGCHELDMVMNIGALKSGYYNYVKEEIADIVKIAEGRIVKVIIESGLLSDEQKVTATQLIIEAGASFVKTSTGFNNIQGATVHDIKLLKRISAGKIKIKASGGLTNLKKVLSMIDAGADRIGTKYTENIMKEVSD